MKSKTLIIRIANGWGDLHTREDWLPILDYIAAGTAFGVWNGTLNDCPKGWQEGMRVALRVKVGKKRKLVRGRIHFEFDYCDRHNFKDYYRCLFTPTRARNLRHRRLEIAVVEETIPTYPDTMPMMPVAHALASLDTVRELPSIFDDEDEFSQSGTFGLNPDREAKVWENILNAPDTQKEM